jgi:hydroxymethylbilane synthase
VHSLKDMPTEQPEGLVISAVLKRAEFRDALVSNTLNSWDDIKPGHVIATSSVRRKAQILKLKPGIEVIDIRGNVNTRLKKLNEGCCDATIMAAAGLQRIGLDSYIKQVLPETIFMPAVSQGIIAIESRVDDLEITQILNSINHEKTFLAAEAERAFLGVLEGGCQLPVACYTIFSENRFTIHGLVASIDGKTSIQQQKSGAKEHAVELSKELANYLLNNGAKQILLSLKK